MPTGIGGHHASSIVVVPATRFAAPRGRVWRALGPIVLPAVIAEPAGMAKANHDRLRAAARLQRAEADQARLLARLDQQAIDGEIRGTRRRLLTRLRERLRHDHEALSSEEFLAVADFPAVLDAILLTATIVGAADACDLQLPDPATGMLVIVRHRGFSANFLAYFAVVGPREATACATAATTGEPVIVDDIAESPIFAGQPTLEMMLAAGSRAVHSHPLHDEDGRLLGVLSFHYRITHPRRGHPELVAWQAARALGGTHGAASAFRAD
jgi:GAF domain-containing protein